MFESYRSRCEEWLVAFLRERGETNSRLIKHAAAEQGFSDTALARARKSLPITIRTLSTVPPGTTWTLQAQR